MLAQAEASLTLEPEFYIVLGMQLLKRSPGMPVLNPFSELANLAGSSRKKATPAPPIPPETEWSALARECLQKAEALRPADPAIKEQIRNTLMLVRPDMALPYAEELVRLQPEDPNSRLMLGMALDLIQKEQESKKVMQEATRLARRKGDTKMARQIEEIGRELRNPIFRLMGGLRGLLDVMGMDDAGNPPAADGEHAPAGI